MGHISMKQLATALPANIQHLATLIARKPQEYTDQWAATADESFSLYTRTRTVNLVLAWNDALADSGWPFPAFLNLREELDVLRGRPAGWRRPISWIALQILDRLGATPDSTEAEQIREMNESMVRIFSRRHERIFRYWLNHPLLDSKRRILKDIEATYRNRLFAACIPTLLPLLDFVMREYFQTGRLQTTLQTLRDAFDKAGILPQHLKPGFAIWDANREGTGSLFSAIENDLRLPGVLLSSFVEFGGSYYAWYRTAMARKSQMLNRHAIMHCAADYWTVENTTKLLTFFDLTLRLERVLRVVIHGSNHDGRKR